MTNNIPFRILGVSGSLRQGSYNTALLQAAAELAPEGVEVTIFEGLRDLPHYDEDLRLAEPQPAVDRLKEAIRAADAVILTTPEFNGGMSGSLKNAIDWVSRPIAENPLRAKPVGLMSASLMLLGGVRGQQQLREVLGASFILPARPVLVGAAHEKFDAAGRLTDAATREFIRDYVVELVDWADRLGHRDAALAEEAAS